MYPTPTRVCEERTITCGENKTEVSCRGGKEGSNLRSKTIGRNLYLVKMYPTPTARDYKDGVSTDLETEQRTISAKDSVEEQQTWWQIESNICGVPNGIPELARQSQQN